MAGIKITELPVLTTPANDDKLYIVDVSDTSESAEGTSKQIDKGDLMPTITSTDNSITIDNTDPSAPDLSIPSGTFNPTISNITDSATISSDSGIYSRAGGVVTGMFTFEVQMDVASNSTSFDFTLPVNTVFANRSQLLCTSNIVTNLVEIVGDAIVGQSKGNLSITSANNGDNLLELTVCYQYVIV